MSDRGHMLYDDGHHKCISFSGLVEGGGVQANQFLIIDGDHAAIIDPGGDLTYTPLTMAVLKHMRIESISYVIASHQDPDIIASMPRWLIHTQAQVVISALWARFLPHLNSNFTSERIKNGFDNRLITIPDEGARLTLGDSEICCLPAHFMHSVGNFQFYDPISKILFSGDMGASIVEHAGEAVDDFAEHINHMEGFHKRYMSSRRVNAIWANAVRSIDVDMMVPQHGKRFEGKPMVAKFLSWIENLDCGVDLLTPENYNYKRVVC